MTASPWLPLRRLVPLAALTALAACAPSEFRDDAPGRAQAFPPVRTQTLTPSAGTPSAALDAPAQTGRRTWSQTQGVPPKAAPSRPNDDDPQPRRRRGSSSPPPDPAALPQPPRPVPLPPVPSTQAATDAFKRDLIRPEVDRMRTDDAMGRLDPLGQRDLMRRENDLRQLGDPLAR
ncbi:hypothetical protein ACIU1J_08330 [Azospirillum doebereinerae]|uniref:hypothetical protein n=1 Tax=Azospirillum doebereinerae TaxID=92933 RepID=UPI001EE59740|nr:hypothetical protein [Azospirillum doebereinerae]MCG5240168.1 hypothetical protein [Azospirillum doebereinerae]